MSVHFNFCQLFSNAFSYVFVHGFGSLIVTLKTIFKKYALHNRFMADTAHGMFECRPLRFVFVTLKKPKLLRGSNVYIHLNNF